MALTSRNSQKPAPHCFQVKGQLFLLSVVRHSLLYQGNNYEQPRSSNATRLRPEQCWHAARLEQCPPTRRNPALRNHHQGYCDSGVIGTAIFYAYKQFTHYQTSKVSKCVVETGNGHQADISEDGPKAVTCEKRRENVFKVTINLEGGEKQRSEDSPDLPQHYKVIDPPAARFRRADHGPLAIPG